MSAEPLHGDENGHGCVRSLKLKLFSKFDCTIQKLLEKHTADRSELITGAYLCIFSLAISPVTKSTYLINHFLRILTFYLDSIHVAADNSIVQILRDKCVQISAENWI